MLSALRGIRPLLVGLALSVIVAGSPAAAPTQSSPTGASAGGVVARLQSALSARTLMAGVRDYARERDHLTGTPRGEAEIARIGDELRANGLRLHRQAYTFPRFVPTRVALTVDSRPVPRRALAPMLYSGRTSRNGVAGRLFDGGDGTFDASAVKGKIVVARIGYVANALAVNLDTAIAAAERGRAKALVAVTDAVDDYPKWEDVNARGGTGRLPVVMVGKRSGARMIDAAKAGASARLILQAKIGTACATDVWGVLTGRDPRRRVIVGTPSSSFIPAASERGSGVAVLLGLARHYARLPLRSRPETLVFLATSGHEIGFLGLPALIGAHRQWFEDADAYVHLGASIGAPTATEFPSGRIHVMPVPDPTGSLYDSENPLLDAAIPAAFARSGIDLRDTLPHLRIVGEQAYAYHVGVPLVSFSGASLYFHTAGDQPRTVDPALLADEAAGFRRSIDAIMAMPAGALRRANSHARAYGAKLDPNPTLGTGRHGGRGPRPVSGCPSSMLSRTR